MAYQPKSYRKFVATAATATLVASAVTPAFAAETGAAASFTDVSDRYKEAVDYLLAEQITNGYTDTQFGTTMNIKRVDAAIMIAKALDLDLDNRPSSGFNDVPDRAAVYIDALKDEGIVNGKDANTFGAADNITRGEMALIMAKAYGLTGDGSDLPFTDVAPRYQDAVAALVDAGITFGKDDDTFGTTASITRGEFALFIYRAETSDEITLSGVTASVNDKDVTVSATIANAPEGATAKIEIFANGGSTVAGTQTVAVVDGKVSATFTGLPSGTHTAKVSVDGKSGQTNFTIAAAPTPQVQNVVADIAGQEVTVIFTKPVDSVSASNVNNYQYDNDRTNTSNPYDRPTGVSVNTSSVGPYDAGQVVTLTFATGTIAAGQEASLSVQGVKGTDGATLDSFRTNITPVTVGGVPTAAVTLSNGAQTGLQDINANAGDKVTLNVNASANGADVSSIRYRVQRPDNTFTAWTNISALDGDFDETSETGRITVDTAGWAGGTYNVQVQVVDAAGQVTTSLLTPASSTSSINIVETDITAPQAAVAGYTAVYNQTTSESAAARTVTVKGSATDADSNVTNVQYRVQSYNSDTAAYTTTTDWSNAVATDGLFNERTEAYEFTTPQLNNETSYRVQVRAVDAQGNTSEAQTLSLTSAGNTSNTGLPAGTFRLPANTGDTTPPAFTVAPTLTIDGQVNPARTNKTSAQITGTVSDVAGATPGTISKVEYAVYRDADENASYETEVSSYTTSGVSANNGSFNEATEAFTINYNLPTTNGNYRILVRATDNSGNVVVTNLDTILDTQAPTATIVPNADTAANDDFIVTFNESVSLTDGDPTTPGIQFETANNQTSGNVADPDNYTIKQLGQVVGTTPTTISQVSARQFIVTFSAEPTNGQTVNLTSVKDLAGNEISPVSYTVNR